MQNFDAVGLIRVPLTAVQSPSRNRLQPANVVRRTVGAVGQMGLARHLDQASAYSPIIKARIRSLTSRARAEGVESWGSRTASRGALARLSKDYYYGWALGGAQGRSGHQYLLFTAGCFMSPPTPPKRHSIKPHPRTPARLCRVRPIAEEARSFQRTGTTV